MKQVPASVRVAAWILIAYGALVLLNAVIWQAIGGWVDVSDFPRALVRCFGMWLVGWGLLKSKRWAWWLGVVLVGVFLLVGGGALILYLISGGLKGSMPTSLLLLMFVSMLALIGAMTLLLLPSSREAFRRPAV